MGSRETDEFNPTTRLAPIESRHVSVFRSSPNIILLLDSSSCILDANPAALNKMGLSLEGARGLVWANCLSEQSRIRLVEGLRRVLSEKIILPAFEVEVPIPGSSNQYYEINLTPIADQETPDAVLVLAHDQTERNLREQKLRESQALYRTLVEDTADIVFQLDAQGRITYVSPAVEQIGLTPDFLNGKNLLSFLHPTEMQPVHAAITRALAGSSESFEYLYSPNGKEERRLHITLRPVLEKNQQVGVRGILSDLEPFRQFDHMLERRAAKLATLNQIGREISSALDLDEVLHNAVNLLQASFGYYHVAVFTPDEKTGDAIMRARAGAYAQHFPPGHSLRAGKGMIGWIFANRRTLLANDVTNEASYVNLYPDRIPSRSELAVPILIRGKLAGALDLQSPLINAFAEDDVHVIETVASQLAVAMANAQLFAQAQERLREKQQAEDLLRLQRDMLAAVGQSLNFQSALDQILAILSPTQIFDSGSIYLVEASGGMCAMAHAGLTPEFATAVAFLPAEANKTRFIKLGKPGYLRYADLEYDQRIPSGVRQREAMLSLAMLPILRQEEVIACLTLGSHLSIEIPPQVRLVLEAVSEQLGAVISRLKVERDLSINKARDQALLEALPDFMFIMDHQGRFLTAKPAIDMRTVVPAESFLGRHVGELMPPNVANLILVMLHLTLETRQVQEFEYQLMAEPGRAEFFEARMSAASDDQVVTIVRNITQRHHAEQDMERHNHALEEMNQRLLEVDRIKSQFLANISHELRTPLSSIIGFSEVLQDNSDSLPAVERQEYLENIHDGGLHLLSLINDLLDFAKIETNRMTLDLSTFPLTSLVEEICTAFYVLLNKSRQTLKVEIKPDFGVITADRIRLKQILFNLVGNANKFTPENGSIRIGASRQDDGWILYVADNGPGIAADFHQTIFEGFSQLAPPAASHRASGTGLGLAITRQLAELHGGRAWLESSLGEGACFYVFFPSQPPHYLEIF